MYCTNCGNKIEVEAKFCSSCGAPNKNVKVETIGEVNEIRRSENAINQSGQRKASTRKSIWFGKNIKIRLWAFLFRVLYYIYKGLWKKGLLLYSLGLILETILVFFTQLINWYENGFIELLFIFLYGTMSPILFGVMGPIDVHRKEYSNETMWKEVPSVFSKGPVVIVVTIVVVTFSAYLKV